MDPFRRIAVLLPTSLILVAVACSSSGDSASPSVAPTSTSALAAESASPTARPADVPVTVRQWSVDAPTTLPAGATTFAITNTGTKEHEFVVYQTETLAADIPIASFEGEKDRINEDTNGTNLGESGDLDPGGTATLTVDLPPGHYVFFCNLPRHYRMGMRLDVTVR